MKIVLAQAVKCNKDNWECSSLILTQFELDKNLTPQQPNGVNRTKVQKDAMVHTRKKQKTKQNKILVNKEIIKFKRNII